jgi:triacylglycerol lipase
LSAILTIVRAEPPRFAASPALVPALALALAIASGVAGGACGSSSEADSGSGGAGGGEEDAEAGRGGGGFSGHAAGGGSGGGGGEAGLDAASKLGPPYPVVLAHGFFGFEEFAGIGFATYFYGVKTHLAAAGETLVFTPAVDPFNDSTYRGKQLVERIEAILAETGHAKVNIIGHSQGGLDARVVAFERPDLVASVTTFATPHQGTPIADVVLKLIANQEAQKFIDWLVKMAAAPLYDQAGQETALSKPMHQFSQQGIAEFNATYSDRAAVAYYSLAGRSDWTLGGAACAVADAPAFVADWKAERDPIDPALALTEAMLDGGLADPYPNDGLVRVESAKWGRFLGCVPADHLDQIGHLFGDSPGLGNAWKYLGFYASLVAFLRAEGF